MDSDLLNVLVIDDDPAMVQLLSDVIHRAEHQVVTATSAEEGLELLPFWTFQVAFIDQKLPGMDGLVLGEYLRRNNPDMTIALVTGDDDRKLQRKSRDLQIVYIAKPFVVGDIIDVLAAYVEAAKERQENRRNARDAHHAPPIASYIDELGPAFDMPNVPSRLEDRLVGAIKRSLQNLRSVGRYTERDRVIALSGLLCAKVMNIDIRSGGDRSVYEEYDALMKAQGRRTEFSEE